MKNLTWQNPEQLFVAQELINKVKSKCCGIKEEMIDDLVKEMGHSPHRMSKKDKIKLIDIDFENIDVVTLMQVQARISRLILEKSK